MRRLVHGLSLCGALAGCGPIGDPNATGPQGSAGPATGMDCGDEELVLLYADTDGDGHGDPNESLELCPDTPGWVTQGTDCDDTDPNVSPHAPERCSGMDDDCDGLVDLDDDDLTEETARGWPDRDGDGWGDDDAEALEPCDDNPLATVRGDCDDDDDDVSPSATEVCGNGIDDNCDGNGCTGPRDGWTTDAHLILASPDEADGTGRAVAAVDLDGDGAAELVTGTPWSNTTGFGAGGLAVVSPATEPWGQVSVSNYAWSGGSVDDGGLGGALAVVGDADGDGRADIALSATGEGATLLVSADVLPRPDDAGALTGTWLLDATGGRHSVSPAGDLDGDGLADLIVSKPDAILGAGRAWVVYGERGGLGESVSLDRTPHALRGDNPGDGIAPHNGTVAHGDLDGDGWTDLVVGLPGADGPGRDAGAAVVIYGTGARLDRLVRADETDARLRGPERDAFFGAAVAVLGDVDGDGRPELAVGAPGADDRAGGVFVYRAEATRWSEVGVEDAAVRMLSTDSEAQVGTALLGPGDLNADGVADLVVGVAADDVRGSALGARGSVRVYDGAQLSGTVLSSGDAWRVTGDTLDARVGSPGSIAAGDFDSDGHTDLAIGVPGVGEVGVFYLGGL